MTNKDVVQGNNVRGHHNNVGIFYGIDSKELDKILQTQMESFSAQNAEIREKIEYMLSDKINALLLAISPKLTLAEKGVSDLIEQNFNKLKSEQECKLKSELGKAVESIKNKLDKAGDNTQAELDKLGRTFSSEAAKAVQQLNDIQDSLQVLQSQSEKLGGKTYAEIMIMAHKMDCLTTSNGKIMEELSENGLKNSETQGKILKMLETVLSEIRSAKSEKAEIPQNYDQILYECMDEARDIEKGKAIVLNSVKNYKNSKNADSILEEINDQLQAWAVWVKGEIKSFHAEHEEIVRLVRKLSEKVEPVKHQHGEDCVRCGAPGARIYKCDICDSMPGESDDLSTGFWGSDWWDGEGLMLVRGRGFENQTVNLRNYAESLPAEMIQRIIFDTDVREIYCQDMDMGVPQYKNICALFPNLKCLALRKPIDGQEKEYCILGESLFSGCEHLRLYGMKYVKDLKPHCFAGWGITDENHNEFIDRYFSKNLHTTLSVKGMRRKDWRT